ncbi:tetratricopeptide repeat protein [bacterium]|nr:tetratricopeptide repeat protein [bacterium]
MQLTHEQLEPLLGLYERGLYLQAYEASLPYGSMKEWKGPRGRTLAGRLSNHLGAPRLSRWHRLKAFRESPDDVEVAYYHGYSLIESHGPLAAWQFLKSRPDPVEADQDIRSSWYTLHAQILCALRDYGAAEPWLSRAEALTPESPWVHVTWGQFHEEQDAYDEALQAIDRALACQPWYRPAVQAKGHLLPLMGQDDAAAVFLREAVTHIESMAVQLQLASILLEQEDYATLGSTLKQVEQLSPLMEPKFAESLASLRSLIAYRQGDLESAIKYARQGEDKFLKKLADRLEDPERRQRPRVHLPVGFVRQHYQTCVPATLSAISAYWSQPAEHLAVAEAICYEGTSAYNERRWANENGWYTREFTISEESATQLIDAGIPFTLTTTDPGSGHLQAVIGYDGLRGTLIIRDPYLRNWGESFADGLCERYQAFGPRGMALVPVAERQRLEALELPDAALWDRLHALDGALEQHQRELAGTVFQELKEVAADYRIALEAERRLMIYDSNPTGTLAVLDKLVACYPDDPTLQLSRMSRLRELSRRDERLVALEELSSKKDAHPAFLGQLAQELCSDAREYDRALRLLRKGIRLWPRDSGNYYLTAGILSDRLQFTDALEMYRFAACLDDKNEYLAEAYFRMAYYQQQTAEALAWLQKRALRFQTRSSRPTRTLNWALRRLNRHEEADKVLEAAIAQHPDDGDLLLYAAEVVSGTSHAQIKRAVQYCEQARAHCSEADWLNTRARLASLQGDRATALECGQRLADMQPLTVSVQRSLAVLLWETESREAALDYLKSLVERFPHHQPTLSLYVEWLGDESFEVAEPALRQLLEVNPTDAWAHRELGFRLLREQRYEAAAECAAESSRLDPNNAASHHLQGELAASRGQMAEARAEYQAALLLSIDNDYAIGELIRCCETTAERREALAFIFEQLTQQYISGDGLLSYRGYASSLVEPEELLAQLRRGLEARPDLWHAWSATVQQLCDMEQYDAALELAQQATQKFPLLPRIWLDLARVQRLRLDFEGEQTALEQAYEINPQWSDVIRQLSDLELRRNELTKAANWLNKAIENDPLEGPNYELLADVQWHQGERETALENIEKALELAPGYSWAWDRMQEWSQTLHDHARPIRVARELTTRRPGEARSWLMLSQMLADQPDSLEEQLQALTKALELNPRAIDAYDQQAMALYRAGRTEEALAACHPTVFGDQVPVDLQAREAWMEWDRGAQDRAIEKMRATVEADPSYYGGWGCLAEWLDQRDDTIGYLEAAKMLVRLDPHGERALGTLANALLRTGDRGGAKQVFHRAYELNPSYGYAGLCLFDMQIEDDEYDAAQQTLETLKLHVGGPFVTGKGVVYACGTKDRIRARQLLEELCAEPPENPWPLRTAYQAMMDAEWQTDVREVLEATLEQENVTEEMAALWAKVRSQLGLGELDRELKDLSARNPIAGGAAVYAYIERLVQKNLPMEFRRFRKKNEAWLRTNVRTWGAVGWGLTALLDYKAAYAWLKDWREHPDAEPWMLVNAAEAYRFLQKNSEAAEISRRALSIPRDPSSPRDHGNQLHRLWLACDDVVAQRFSDAAELMQHVSANSLDENYLFLWTLVQGVLSVEASAPSERKQTFRSVSREINQAAASYQYFQQEPARRRFFFQALATIARITGGWRPRLWQWYWQLVR